MAFYLDTSALVKRYWEEDGSDFIHELYEFEQRKGESLYTANHTIVEFGSAAMRLVREKRFTQEEALGIIDFFKKDSSNTLMFIHLNQPLIYKSLNMLIKYPLKAADAMQLACAADANAHLGLEEFCFISDDKRLCDAAENEGFKTLRPGDETSKTYLSNL